MSKPLTVVISTRKIDLEYVKHIKKVFSHPKTQLLIYENDNQFSLAELYNRGLDESINEIVVFCHDDLIIETNNLSNKIQTLFNRNPEFGIIGLAGTDLLDSGVWWSHRDHMFGQVKHKNNGATHRNNYSVPFPDIPKEVVIVDGLFFAIHKERIKERFDVDFPGFHFYDLPFCVSNYLNNVKIGVTTKILVTHKSVGMINKKWEKNKLLFEAKYEKYFPLKV